MGRAGNVKAKEPPERRDYPPVRLMKGRWLTAQVLPVLNPDSLEACFCFDCSPKSHFRGATALIGGRAEPHTSIERLSLRSPPTCLRQVCLHAPTKCLLVIAVNNEWPQWAFHQSEKTGTETEGRVSSHVCPRFIILTETETSPDWCTPVRSEVTWSTVLGKPTFRSNALFALHPKKVTNSVTFYGKCCVTWNIMESACLFVFKGVIWCFF